MGCRRKNTLCLSLDFGANDGTLLPRLTRLETSPSLQKRLVLKFPIIDYVQSEWRFQKADFQQRTRERNLNAALSRKREKCNVLIN